MDDASTDLIPIVWKTVVVHTVTYFVAGVISFVAFDYPARWEDPLMVCLMRPLDDPIVRAGLLFQPLRGLVFGLVFFPLREAFFERSRGWLLLWWTLFALAILNTFGPATGSIEGMVYTNFPALGQIAGWPEVVAQSGALAGVLAYWVRHPRARWLTWLLHLAFVVTLGMTVMGLVMAPR